MSFLSRSEYDRGVRSLMVLCSFYCSSYNLLIGNTVLKAYHLETARRPSTAGDAFFSCSIEHCFGESGQHLLARRSTVSGAASTKLYLQISQRICMAYGCLLRMLPDMYEFFDASALLSESPDLIVN